MHTPHPSLTMSATALARAIASQQMSSRQIVDAHIDRINQTNPIIRAVVADRFDMARAEADAADAAVKEGHSDLPLLHGVPCTIKEAFAVDGMPWTSGTRSRAGITADHDAVCVKRWRDAGAIVLGVTNTSELCMWMESYNPIYGRTGNPWDPSRTAGGSSGGEGSIVGAGGSPFGLGADVGGSIRMPAFFNGVWGHKPSAGLVPNTGQYPNAHTIEGSRMLGSGPICRHVEDLAPLLRLLVGSDGVDPACDGSLTLADVAGVSLRGLRVIDVPNNGNGLVDDSLVKAQQDAASTLASLGASVHPTHIPSLKHAFTLWSAAMSVSNGRSGFRKMLQVHSHRAMIPHVLRPAEVGGSISFPAAILGLIEDVGSHLPGGPDKALAQAASMRADLIDLIGDGVMLYPSHPVPAPKHGTPLLHPFRWVYTALLNVMGFPVTQVPLGLNAQGLPVGVQVIAAPNRDHVTIAVGQALANAGIAGWQLPNVQ